MSLKKIKKSGALLLLLFFTVSVILAGTVWAAEPATEEGQPLVTATFFETDLREALHEISIQTGVNLAVDETVRGLVTLELKNTPFEKALKMVLINGGFSYHKVDDFYVIGLPDPRNPAFAGLSETEVYFFKNIGAESAKAMLPEFYKPFVKFGTGVKESQDTATVNAPPDLLAKIMADLAKMDGQREQLKIKALVTEISNEVLKEWGMDLLNVDFNAAGVGVRTVGLNVPKGSISGEGDGSFGHFTATIKALVNEKKATIHADPEILVTEGKTGDLFVGEKRTLILYSQGTNASTSSTENVEAGATLKVTPKLVGEQIELTVSQKISDFDDGTTDEIIVKSREFSSVVRFLPGQTVMVAGLTQKQTRDNTLKTPILGDIPIVGLLFKQKSKLKGDSELLVFLTAEVVK
ncbi:MAG: type II secretion system protein GspD [Bacillota bacterium]